MARAPSLASIPGRSRLQFLSLPCFCRSPKPSEGEAEGAEQLPFLIVIPSGFSREQSAVDNPARTCGADPSCPRDSVPDDVRRERPRSCWHRLREDSLVPHPFPFCAKGGSHPMWRGHSCPRDPIPDDVGESVLARAPLTIVILEKRSPALAQDSRRRTYAFPGYPHAPAKFGAEQAGNGTTSSP